MYIYIYIYTYTCEVTYGQPQVAEPVYMTAPQGFDQIDANGDLLQCAVVSQY